MSVGIFLPAYNVAAFGAGHKSDYIGASLESILNQTYVDWELVILDDCSTDMTVNNINHFFDKHYGQINGRMTLLPIPEEHNGFIGRLKNECIRNFKKQHEFICHVGADDLIPDYCLSTFVDYFGKHTNVDACCGKFECFSGVDVNDVWMFPHTKNLKEYDPKVLLQYMNMTPMRFYKKSLIDKIGGYAENITSAVDYDLALRIDENGAKVHRIYDKITYKYRQHQNQVSTKFREEQNANAKLALERSLKRRDIEAVVINIKPPFKIKYKEKTHFIWK